MKQVNLFLMALAVSFGLQAQRVTNYTPSMYRNLEKYWWYRYRLVNDFMKIGMACGESIPMEKWDFNCGTDYPDTHTTYEFFSVSKSVKWFILRSK